MLLLDDTSPSAVVVDPAAPASAGRIDEVLVAAWPRLARRVEYVRRKLDEVRLLERDVVVSCHACGALSDRIIAAAVAARTKLAVLPCCHDEDTCDPGGLTGWMDLALAVDSARVLKLGASGYDVRTQTISRGITPKNRLILAAPA